MEKIGCRYIKIGDPEIPDNKYGIYPDGSVINLETKTIISSFMRENEPYINLFGQYKRTARPVAFLLAKAYLPQTEEDIRMNRNKADVIDIHKLPKINNIRWVSSLEKTIIKRMKKNPPTCNKDYVEHFCELFKHGYSVSEACKFLGFKNKLYAYNIRNRRIYSYISSKYKW